MVPVDFKITDYGDYCQGECLLQVCEECGGLYCDRCDNEWHSVECKKEEDE